MLRVLSLNVTDRGTALHHQLLARLDELAPDLVTLQEVRSATVARWCADLRAAGYHLADTLELHTTHVPNASTGIKLYCQGQRALGRERMMKKGERC